MDNTPPLSQLLVLGTLEVLLNQALAVHPQGRQSLERLAGITVRVRAFEPDFIFYCLVDVDGIELRTEFDGDTQVRVRGSAGNLLHHALLPPNESHPADANDIQIDGDVTAVAALRDALETFNLWEALRTWLREHVAMPEIFGLLRQHDPAWLERLQDMPQLVAELLAESRRQGHIQNEILQEVRSLKESLRSERRTDILCITIGIAMLALALLTASGALPVLVSRHDLAEEQTWTLAILGLALMLSRLFGKRYGTT